MLFLYERSTLARVTLLRPFFSLSPTAIAGFTRSRACKCKSAILEALKAQIDAVCIAKLERIDEQVAAAGVRRDCGYARGR